ncbi:Thymidine phosphorylase [Armadillidium vulgare]|nr:Thymidine phosphorylase [Armadillidium vulgare]
MISGRGLAHTGGTLDKLESIPGLKVFLSEEEMRKTLESVGCCIVGQTSSIVPADKRMYAARDVTATVPSTPLIVSSIIGKKASESLNSLVLDVKYGSGSFMKSKNEAEALAKALIENGNSLGIRTTALVNSMESPLGRKVGNALEVEEALQCLRGEGPEELSDLVLNLGMLM